MKYLFIAVLFPLFMLLNSNCYAQEESSITTSNTIYFVQKANGKLKPSNINKANRYLLRVYLNGKLIEKKMYYFPSHNLLKHSYYKDGRPVGKWEYFDEAGKLLRERDFEKLKYKPCTKKDSLPQDNFTMPVFGNGEADLLEYLSKNIVYPEETKDGGTTGFVYINFTIDKTGRAIPDHICDSGLDGYTDLVVWEIVENMPLWTPGIVEGENVEVSYILPISFRLR